MSIKKCIRDILRLCGYRLTRLTADNAPESNGGGALRPMDLQHLDILADEAFRNACRMLGDSTLLDTPRLANLWALCRETDPSGAIAEIGVYRGGGSLLLSHCCPGRELLVFDPFDTESFERLDPGLDRLFYRGQFAATNQAAVERLLAGRRARVVPGYFPASAKGKSLPRISFVHLDVDVYAAMRESLEFLMQPGSLCERSLLVVDDFRRGADGVDQAVRELTLKFPGWLALPLFPGQGLLIPRAWFAKSL